MKTVIYLLCTLAILVQLPTAADIFLGTYDMVYFGPTVRYFQAFGYATVFEVSILIFVVQRRLWYAGVFAFFSLLTNLISHNVWAWLTASAPFLISIQLPLAIAIYSHELERLRKKPQPAPAQEPERKTRRPVMVPSYDNRPSVAAKNGNGQYYAVPEPRPTNGHTTASASSSIIPETQTVKDLAGSERQAETLLMEPNRICEQCETAFYSTNLSKRFCKPACRSKFHRDNPKADGKEAEKEGDE